MAYFVGSCPGRGQRGRQCCRTHTCHRRKCPAWAAHKAAFVCTNTPSTLLLQLQHPQRLTSSCWKQLWTADKEGISIGTFLIKSADSNKPANLRIIFFFQCVAFTKLLRIWAKHRNTLFWCFQRKPLYSFAFNALQQMVWFILWSCLTLDGVWKELVFKEIKLN